MATRKIFNSPDGNLTNFHTHPKRAPLYKFDIGPNLIK